MSRGRYNEWKSNLLLLNFTLFSDVVDGIHELMEDQYPGNRPLVDETDPFGGGSHDSNRQYEYGETHPLVDFRVGGGKTLRVFLELRGCVWMQV